MAYASKGGGPRTAAGKSAGPARLPRALPQAPVRRSTTFIAGIGIGLVIGAAAALLLAPQSGTETRRALRNRGKRVRNKATDAWEDLRLELMRTQRALKRKRRDARMDSDADAAEHTP